MNVLNKFNFESRGALGCDNSDYHLQRTMCCGSFAVEDAELSDLYIDPNDLSQSVTLLYDPRSERPPACPFCGAGEWDMIEILDVSNVPQEWRWAACG